MSHSCVFMGTPAFALPALQALIASPYEVKAVVTQPDRPVGRGRKLAESDVKRHAVAAGLPVLQPARVRDEEAVSKLKELAPDFIVVAAYGLLIPPAVLAIPPHGTLNIHPSLLPLHRGASPIQAAIRSGEDTTGVSIMLMDEGLDTGPILAQRRVRIFPNESAGELGSRLAPLASDLLMQTLPQWLDGSISPQLQGDDAATYSPQIKKEEALIDWTLEAETIWRNVRAYNPWPGAESNLAGAQLKIAEAWPLKREDDATPGTVIALEPIRAGDEEITAILVSCGQGTLALLELQKEGRRRLTAAEFARGERGLIGAILGRAKTDAGSVET